MELRDRADLVDVTDRLVREFEGVLPPGSVLRCVTRCRTELVRAGVSAGLPTALEAMAGLRLRHRADGRPWPGAASRSAQGYRGLVRTG